MKRVFHIIFVLSIALTVNASDKRLDEINSIKKNLDYLYAEATKKTIEEATLVSRSMLYEEIIRCLHEKQIIIDSMKAMKLSMQADTIMTRRADMYRVFSYIKKNAFTTYLLPKDSTLVNDSVMIILSHHFLNKNIINNNSIIQKIMKARNFFELREIMKPLKENGEIIDYGKYASAANLKDSYLIIYDQAGNIKAWLGKGDNIRMNLKTRKEDSVKNYHGCGAIWFRIRE